MELSFENEEYAICISIEWLTMDKFVAIYNKYKLYINVLGKKTEKNDTHLGWEKGFQHINLLITLGENFSATIWPR